MSEKAKLTRLCFIEGEEKILGFCNALAYQKALGSFQVLSLGSSAGFSNLHWTETPSVRAETKRQLLREWLPVAEGARALGGNRRRLCWTDVTTSTSLTRARALRKAVDVDVDVDIDRSGAKPLHD